MGGEHAFINPYVIPYTSAIGVSRAAAAQKQMPRGDPVADPVVAKLAIDVKLQMHPARSARLPLPRNGQVVPIVGSAQSCQIVRDNTGVVSVDAESGSTVIVDPEFPVVLVGRIVEDRIVVVERPRVIPQGDRA